MDSPTHRANIVKEKYREIGVGMAKGKYQGRTAIYVVQFFGTPKAGAASYAAAPAPAVAAEPSPSPVSVVSPAASATAASSSVAGAEFDAPREAAVAAVVSPRSVGTYVLWGVLALVTLAFATAVFVAIRVQFRAIILGGVFLIVLAAALLWFTRREAPVDRLLHDLPATTTETSAR
jgi:hypothetical protein